MKNFKSITILFVLLICMISTYAQTDKKIDRSKAFQIGDTFIPPSAVQVMRGIGKSIDWQTLQNKVVILDFFDTYCGTCIQSMPKLQKLQDKLKDKLQIINVGWQDKATLDKFFANNAYLKENKVNLSVIYGDVYLKEQFPHLGVPHVVFLFKGKVRAITFSNMITEENILNLLNTETIDLPLKDDFGKGNLIGQGINTNQDIKAGVWISGYQNGVPSQALEFLTDSTTGKITSSFYNRSIFRALLNTWAKIKIPSYFLTKDRIVWKVKDPVQYDDVTNMGELWESKNAISYERLDRVHRSDSAQAIVVLEDLHRYFGIKTYWTPMKIKCLILQTCGKKESSNKVYANKRKYHGSSVFTNALAFNGNFPPVIDRIKNTGMIEIDTTVSLDELNEQLHVYGMEAVYGQEELEVFVIEEIEN